MERPRKIRLALIGIGNTAMSDDGLGVVIIEELSKRWLPEGVRLTVLGSDPLDLLLMDDRPDGLIIIDAVRGEGRPGTLHTLGVGDILDRGALKPSGSLHRLGLPQTLRLLEAMDEVQDIPVFLFGIEAAVLDPGLELSTEVAEKLPTIVDTVVAEILSIYNTWERNPKTFSRRRQIEHDHKTFTEAPHA